MVIHNIALNCSSAVSRGERRMYLLISTPDGAISTRALTIGAPNVYLIPCIVGMLGPPDLTSRKMIPCDEPLLSF